MKKRSAIETLLGAAPAPPLMPDRGDFITNLRDVRFGEITAISSADWSLYSTCRGRVPQVALAKLVDVLLDSSNQFSEDDHSEAESEGLWDWICHQSTLYSVSPLFLDLALTKCREVGRTPPAIEKLASLFSESGSRSIYLTGKEYELNQQNRLPLFLVEDVLKKHRWIRTKSTSGS